MKKPDSQILLALDLGNTTGWAMWQDGVVTSGSCNFAKSKNSRFEGPGMRFVRFVRFLGECPTPTLLSFEEVRRHRGVAAAHSYGGYLSHVTAFCDSRDPQIPYEGIPVGTIKKRATGSGNCSKEEMIEACQKLMNYEPGDDNEADARWLLLLMCEASNLPWPDGPIPEPKKKKKTKPSRKINHAP